MGLFKSFFVKRDLGLIECRFHECEVGFNAVLNSSVAFIFTYITPGTLDIGKNT
jgi:hypothetical protein